MRLPSPVLVCQAYELTEHFLRKIATPFFTSGNSSTNGGCGHRRPGVSLSRLTRPWLYAAGMSSTDDPGAGSADATARARQAEAIVTHAEHSISEDAIVAAARERAVDIGAGAVTPAVGALLCVLAKLTGARAVVEVGTGAGVSGLWLLSGMREDGVLTTIDVEPEHQRTAKQAFTEAGVGPGRTRLISGRAQEVLTRLADESYDLVFIDAAPADQPHFVTEGVRLLRAGGAIVVHRSALGGRAGDASAKDAEVAAVREAARLIAEDERLTPVLVPLGDGLLIAARD
ncbi:Putative O-methyltransferase MSMEG_5073/MSMEI_4947 [Mycobacterium sp. smrl_JER01]